MIRFAQEHERPERQPTFYEMTSMPGVKFVTKDTYDELLKTKMRQELELRFYINQTEDYFQKLMRQAEIIRQQEQLIREFISKEKK